MNKENRLQTLVWLLIIFSLIGFGDALYLTVKHYTGGPIVCSILDGCEVVTTSEYSRIFGIPTALLGTIYYLIVFLGSVIYKESGNLKILKNISLLTVVGLLASAWFVYLQAFVINAFCLYCLASATTSTILFVLGMLTLRQLKKIEKL
jgi:uncharacterized membrane protein